MFIFILEHAFSGCSPIESADGLMSSCQDFGCAPGNKRKCELCCEDFCNHPGGNISWNNVDKKPGCDDSVKPTTKGPDGKNGGSNVYNSNVGSGILVIVFIMVAIKKLYSLITGFEDF